MLRTALAPDQVVVWSVPLDPLESPRLDLLSADEFERMQRMVEAVDRAEYALAHAALRQILGECLRTPPRDVEIAYLASGKPSVATETDVRFSLAHSAGLALVAVTRGREVGVDVEALRPYAEVAPVARRYFSMRENECITSSRDPARTFFKFWTRKEAILKLTGRGLRQPLNEVEVIWDGHRSSPRRVGAPSGEAFDLEVQDIACEAPHCAAVAAEGQNWFVVVRGFVSPPRSAHPR
jgi:4'-phosphopantetheinyl transferase